MLLFTPASSSPRSRRSSLEWERIHKKSIRIAAVGQLFFRKHFSIVRLPHLLFALHHGLLMNDLIMWIKQNWSIIIPASCMCGAQPRRREKRFVSPETYLDSSFHLWNVHYEFEPLRTTAWWGRREHEREWHATCVWIINYILSTFLSSSCTFARPPAPCRREHENATCMSWHDSYSAFNQSTETVGAQRRGGEAKLTRNDIELVNSSGEHISRLITIIYMIYLLFILFNNLFFCLIFDSPFAPCEKPVARDRSLNLI